MTLRFYPKPFGTNSKRPKCMHPYPILIGFLSKTLPLVSPLRDEATKRTPTILKKKGAEVCYDRLGCFSDAWPYSGSLQRPSAKLPWTPEQINTRFFLYTRSNQNSYQVISATNPSTISSSNFRTSRKTRFVIHGFTSSGEASWLSQTCRLVHSFANHDNLFNKGRHGLDPAEPYFQDTPAEVRLDLTDAAFVDVIHSLVLVVVLGLQ
ncbi:pancreatic lipase-related protein 2-like [Pyxicephalus adspersus]|uniref:pancreatic lipase-related protein 2-like n=1 Tax=Pyxicephalus adspersus TaxID=30357 RepID=UPI003B5BB967